MSDIETEKRHLAKADCDIAEGEKRIRDQVELIARLRDRGHSVSNAERLLETLRQTLQAWQHHRDEIVRTIARLESGGQFPGTNAGPIEPSSASDSFASKLRPSPLR